MLIKSPQRSVKQMCDVTLKKDEGWNEIERVAHISIRDATLKISTIGIKIKEK